MLEIKNFSKFYGDKKVVDNLSISVQSGDIVVKQSMPVILSGLIGIVALIIPIFLYLVLNLMITYTLQATSIFLLVISSVVYKNLSNSKFI